MKIERKEAKSGFKPFTLEITIESQEECFVLREMACYDETIPNLMDSPENRKKLAEFLNKLNNVL